MSAPREPLTAHLIENVHRAADNIHADTADLTAAVKAARALSSATWEQIGAAAGRSEAWARRAASKGTSDARQAEKPLSDQAELLLEGAATTQYSPQQKTAPALAATSVLRDLTPTKEGLVR